MFRVLKKVLGDDPVSGRLRIAGKGQVFLVDLARRSANPAFGSIGIVTLVSGMARFADRAAAQSFSVHSRSLVLSMFVVSVFVVSVVVKPGVMVRPVMRFRGKPSSSLIHEA